MGLLGPDYVLRISRSPKLNSKPQKDIPLAFGDPNLAYPTKIQIV